MRTPKAGAWVAITGPWVYDRNHDWNEIHPAWRIARPGQR